MCNGHVTVILSVPGTADFTPMQVIKEVDFWLLFLVFAVGSGAGLMVINNIGSIRLTFGGTEGDVTQTSLVITLSVCNFVGRLLFGYLSDRL